MSVLIFGSTNGTSLSSPLEGVSVFLTMAVDCINIKFQWGYDLGDGIMLINPFLNAIQLTKGSSINTSVFEEAALVHD